MYDIIMYSNDGSMHAQRYAMDWGGGYLDLRNLPRPLSFHAMEHRVSACENLNSCGKTSLKATTRIELMSQDENSCL